jgi:hypothetical protein
VELERLACAAGGEALAGGRPAQHGEVPADEGRARRQLDAGDDVRPRAREVDVLLGQPVEAGAVADPAALVLLGEAVIAAVELAGGRRGDQRARAGGDLDVDLDPIAADQAAGGMDEVGVAGAVGLRVIRAQDAERAVVGEVGHHRARAGRHEAHRQRRPPARDRESGRA